MGRTRGNRLTGCWIDGATRRAAEPLLLEAGVTSGEAWPEARLRELTLLPRDLAEGYFAPHAITLNLGPALPVHHHWAGERAGESLIREGAVGVFPAGASLSARWTEPYRLLQLTLAPPLLASAAQDLSVGEARLRPGLGLADEVLVALLLALRDEVRGGQTVGLYAQSLRVMIAAHLVAKHSAAPPPPMRPAPRGLPTRRLRQVTEYIDLHLASPLTLRDLAAVAGLSVFHFLRSFKVATGRAPHAFLRERRIGLAKRLLAQTTLPIVEVALRCGFGDQSSFARAFHRVAGAAPRQFRNQRDRADGRAG